MDIKDHFATGFAVCSEVLLFLASRMLKLKSSEVLEFVATDPHAADAILPWIEMRGYILLEIQELEGNRTRFLIQR